MWILRQPILHYLCRYDIHSVITYATTTLPVAMFWLYGHKRRRPSQTMDQHNHEKIKCQIREHWRTTRQTMKNTSRNLIRNYRHLRTKLKQSWKIFTHKLQKKYRTKWQKYGKNYPRLVPPQTTEIREHHSRREWKGAKWNGRQKNKGTNLDNIQISENHRNRQWRKKKT